MNIAEILKDAPKGTKLYSPLFGEVTFNGIQKDDWPIVIETDDKTNAYFAEDGKYNHHTGCECMLFPSKENRDWNTFKVEKSYDFKPFDKVLVRDTEVGNWCCDYFSHKNADKYYCVGAVCNYCIPYNDDTKHLVGTNKTL